MPVEHEPQGYQFKHPKHISLDEYHGVARDIMELNHSITDGFMGTGDIRKDIAIVQRQHQRTLDYDQVGYVRVAKFLQMPRLDLWRGNPVTQTRREEDVWYIAIDDQELSQQVASANTGQRFDDAFVNAFQREVKDGMDTVLKREKLLNSGEYDMAFLVSYFEMLSKDLLLLPLIELDILLKSSDPIQAAQATAYVAGISALINAATNAVNLLGAGLGWIQDRMGFTASSIRYATFEEPFIKHSVPELVMLPVPLDRLVRGMKYLHDHGKEIIVYENTHKR